MSLLALTYSPNADCWLQTNTMNFVFYKLLSNRRTSSGMQDDAMLFVKSYWPFKLINSLLCRLGNSCFTCWPGYMLFSQFCFCLLPYRNRIRLFLISVPFLPVHDFLACPSLLHIYFFAKLAHFFLSSFHHHIRSFLSPMLLLQLASARPVHSILLFRTIIIV